MRVAYRNFTGGEVTPSLSCRYDLSRYQNSLGLMENFLPSLHGDVFRRPGTYFAEDLGETCTLLPFSFSADARHNFVLVFGKRSLRVADVHGWISGAAIPSPYTAQEALEISYAQAGDAVYLAHAAHPLHKLTRSGSAPAWVWKLGEVVFNSSLPAPAAPSAAWRSGPTSGLSGVAAADTVLRYKISAVDENGKESLPSKVAMCAGRYPSDWISGDRVTLTFAAAGGAAEYNIYRESAGYYGLIGVADARGAAGSMLTFYDENYEPDTSTTPKEDWNPFAGESHPATVCFHQQRLVLGGTSAEPQSIFMSRTGDFENFRKSRPLQDDDPVEYRLASGSVDGIQWISSFGDLIIGTASAEYKAAGSDGGAITATSCTVSTQSCWGSARLAPIIIGNSVMHCQRHGSRVRDLYYSLEKDGYAGNDLSVMAPHLFEGHRIVQWAFQQTPFSALWCVRDDGVLLALTYLKEHDIWGWSRHVTDGRVLSVCTLSGEKSDEVMLAVQRSVQGREVFMLERLMPKWGEADAVEEAFFMDCGLSAAFEQPVQTVGGLSHLEGCTVTALADGSPVSGLAVQEGEVHLPFPARRVHAGLPYRSALRLLPWNADTQAGSTLGLMRSHGRCSVRVLRSVGGKFGTSPDDLSDFPFLPAAWGQACEPYSGCLECTPCGAQETDAALYFVQDSPLPLQIAAVTARLDFGETM